MGAIEPAHDVRGMQVDGYSTDRGDLDPMAQAARQHPGAGA
jgi:hypothetical protein